MLRAGSPGLLTRAALDQVTRVRRAALAFVGAVGVCLVASGGAGAFISLSPPFTSDVALVSAMPNCQNIGPVGAVDDGTHIYVSDVCDDGANYLTGALYEFRQAGGSPGSAIKHVVNGIDFGLAISRGRYYASVGFGSREGVAAGVYAFNPSTLALGKLIASSAQLGGGDPRGIATDPMTGDLYVTNFESGIYKIHNPSGNPVISLFNSVAADGVAFSPDGTKLFVAPFTGTGLPTEVDGFTRSGTQLAGFPVSISGNPDGIAVAPPNDTADGVDISNNVFVNTNGGTLDRIDTQNADAVSAVASGGSRGDFALIDSSGYLDVAQTDGYVRLGPAAFFRPPKSASPPVISGSPVVGQRLTTTNGAWSSLGKLLTFSYQWRRCNSAGSSCVAIAGATAGSYKLTTADIGHQITVNVTARNVYAQPGSASAKPVGPVGS